MYVEEKDVDNAVLYSCYLWQLINRTTDQLIVRHHPDCVERAENVWWVKHGVVCFKFSLKLTLICTSLCVHSENKRVSLLSISSNILNNYNITSPAPTLHKSKTFVQSFQNMDTKMSWNKLPENLTSAPTLISFKTSIN